MAAGEIIQGVRWLRDAAGRLVGYRNPVTDKDEDLSAAALQALVSGAGNIPIPDAVSMGAPASFVDLLGSYITTWSNVPVSEAAMGSTQYANSAGNSHCYVDPVNGDDSNSGFSPAAAKKTLNIAAWTGGTTAFNPDMFLLIKRGSAFTLTSPLGGAGGLSGGRSIGSYGDPTLPRPILRPQPGAIAGTAGLYWQDPDGAKVCDIELDCSGMDSSSPNHGIRMWSSTNTTQMRNILVSNVKVRAPRTGTGSWPAGITVHKRSVESTTAQVVRSGHVRIEQCEVYGGGAHGIMLSGAIGYQNAQGVWMGAEVVDNWVYNCGRDFDSHAITSSGDSAFMMTSSVPWVLASGTTYYVAYNTLVGRSVGDVDMVQMVVTSRDSCTHNLKKNTATPTTPAVGEFGFDNATQRLYVNVNQALGGSDELHSSGTPPRGVLYAGNRCENMILQGNTSFTEGAGLQFDDWTSDSIMIGNRSYNNAGAGMAINRGQRNRLVRNVADGNGRCGVLTNGHGTLIGGNVLRGGSSRNVGNRGLICQDMINGPIGEMVTQIRRNLLIATSQLDAYINQSDVTGYRGNYTIAAGNYGTGPALQQTLGKVLGF